MASCYYDILQIKRDARLEDVHAAYRQLALATHPDKVHVDPTAAKVRFLLIGEAYDVLRHPILRPLYDQLGRSGLTNSFHCIPNYPFGYRYHSQPLRTFEEHFGTIHAYADVYLPRDGTMEYNLYSDIFRARDNDKMPPLVIELEATLEELFHGCVREVEYKRLVVVDDDGTLEDDTVVKDIHILPGWKPGTQCVFEKEGNQTLDMIPSDVIIRLVQLPHDRFIRHGNDLRIKVQVDLLVALCGGDVMLTSIDDTPIRIEETDIIKPNSSRRIAGQGMPLAEDLTSRGDLYLDYEVIFPMDMDLSRRDMVANALRVRPAKVTIPTTLLAVCGPNKQTGESFFDYYPQTPAAEKQNRPVSDAFRVLNGLEMYNERVADFDKKMDRVPVK